MFRFLRVAIGVLLPALILAGLAGSVAAQDDDPGITSAPGDRVIDYAPDTNPADRAVIESVAAMDAALAAPRAVAAQRVEGDEIGAQAASVIYNGDYPSPANVQAVVEAAVADWSAVLDISGPVEIEVLWFPFGNQSVLGSAGFLQAYRGGGLPTDSFTPGPLANVLLNTDIDPADPEIQVVLNSDFGSRWFIGTTGTPTGNQVDLYSVVLHELGHGFGFVGSAFSDNGAAPALSDPPFGYDTHVYHGNNPLLGESDPNSLLTSGNLFFNLPGGDRHRLYAPAGWEQGSSYSHFDEATYTGTDPGALMTPRLGNAEVQRELDAPEIGVMDQIGWPLQSDPPPTDDAVAGGTVTSTAGAAVANLSVDLFQAVDQYNRGQWLGDARTDANGDFSFGGLAPGCYILTYIAPGGATFPASGGQYLNTYECLDAGENNSGLDAVVSLSGGGDPSTIGGTVTNGGSGFGGLTVDLFQANGDGSRGSWLGDTTTDGSGNYSFDNVDQGCFVLVFIAPNGYQMVGGNTWLQQQACVANPGDSVDVDAGVTAG